MDVRRPPAGDQPEQFEARVDYRLTRQGDQFVFDARVLTKKGQAPIPPEAFKDAEVAVSLTFPGPVVSSNGTVSGQTVTWSPNVADVPHLTATGKLTKSAKQPATGSSKSPTPDEPSSVPTALIVGAVVLLAAVALTTTALLRRRVRR